MAKTARSAGRIRSQTQNLEQQREDDDLLVHDRLCPPVAYAAQPAQSGVSEMIAAPAATYTAILVR